MRLCRFLATVVCAVAMPSLAQGQESDPIAENVSAPVAERADPGPANLNGGSSYGLFLAGRAAMSRGDGRTALELLQAALAASDGETILRERVFSSAVLAGDVEAAANAGLVDGESHAALVEAQRLAQATEAMMARRSRPIYRQLQARPIEAPHQLAGTLLSRWLAADAGDWDAALAPVPDNAEALVRILTADYRAVLLERRGRYADAEAQYSALLLDGTATGIVRLPFGEFLERRGRRDEAITVYDGGLRRGADSALQAARDRAASRGRPPAVSTIRQGAALALAHAAAAADVANVNEFVVAYLRMSLTLDPTTGESWIALGEALNELGMPLTAREAWSRTPPTAPEYVEAQIRIATSLDDSGEPEAAAAVARAVSDRSPGPASAFALAAILLGHDEFREVLSVLDSPAAVDGQNWGLEFLRGAAHEQLGEYAQAEAAFQRALALSPDQAEVLNYLGYMWVDRGDRVAEGLVMIERAVAAAPEVGNYQDSLGWAQYRQGRFDEAVQTLERAVALEPGSAVINDHLGDAYWQVGRRREADFQWRQALTLDADETLRSAIQAKLAGAAPDVSGAAIP